MTPSSISKKSKHRSQLSSIQGEDRASSQKKLSTNRDGNWKEKLRQSGQRSQSKGRNIGAKVMVSDVDEGIIDIQADSFAPG